MLIEPYFRLLQFFFYHCSGAVFFYKLLTKIWYFLPDFFKKPTSKINIYYKRLHQHGKNNNGF
jgi:hypothetical protein